MGAFFRIVVPLTAPGISATATYASFLSWQEFPFALTFLSGTMETLPVGVLGNQGACVIARNYPMKAFGITVSVSFHSVTVRCSR